MTWGVAGNINQANLDSDADDPNLARSDIYDAFTELKAVINGRGTADGVASLNSSTKIPTAQIPDNISSSIGNNLILSPDTTRVAVQDIVNLNSRTTAQLNSLSGIAGDVAYCSDGDAGSPCIAVYNGTSWLRVSLGAAIST